jgi:hypothetical protein
MLTPFRGSARQTVCSHFSKAGRVLMENDPEFIDHCVQFGRGIRELNGLSAKLFYPIFEPVGHC